MGRLAQATRRSTTRLRTAAQEAKGLRGSVDPERLQNGIAVMVKMARRLPRPDDIQGLLDNVKAHWEPEQEEPPAKGKGQAAAGPDPKKELLREAVQQYKQIRIVAQVLVAAAKQDSQTFDFIAQPARDIVRAPVPTSRFTLAQMSEWLTLARVFVMFVERYARRMRSS